MQRRVAKIDPRNRPKLVWRPYKNTLAAASPFCPGRAWKGTWSFRRRPPRSPDLAAAPPAAPEDVAVVATTPRRRLRTLAVAPTDLTADPRDLAVDPDVAALDNVRSDCNP